MKKKLLEIKNDIFVKIILESVLGQKLLLAFTLCSLVVLSICQTIFILSIGPLLNLFFKSDTEILNIAEVFPQSVLARLPIKDLAFQYEKTELLSLICGLILVSGFLRSLATFFYQFNIQKISFCLAKDARLKLFSFLLRMSFVSIVKKSPAEWMSAIINDMAFLQNRFMEVVNTCIRDVVLVSSGLLALLLVDYSLAMIFLATFPVVMLLMGSMGKRIARFSEKIQSQLGTLSAAVLSIRRRREFIKAQNAESYEHNYFHKLNREYYQLVRRSIGVRVVFAPFMECLGICFLACFLILKNQEISLGHYSSLHLFILFTAIGMVLRPLRNIGEQFTKLQETRGALKKNKLFFKESSKEDFDDIDNLNEPSLISKKLQIESFQSELSEFRIEAKDLSLAPGEAIAVIGPSGSGKSTLLRTLAGILVPKTWVGEWSWRAFCKQTSWVGQELFLFEDSIKENLRYGNKKRISDGKIWQTLKLVGLEKDIKGFHSGISKNLISYANNISGGQLQRLVLARALLRNDPVMLFDEATSAIDEEVEKSILERLLSHVKSRAKICVFATHRVNNLHLFEQVWFVEDGKVQIKGKHEELLKIPRYREFCSAHSQDFQYG